MIRALAVGVVAVVGACCSRPTPRGPVTPAVDAEVEALACFNLRIHDCPEGDPAPGGDTCEAVLGRKDPRLAFDARCIADATTVAAIRACPNVRCAAR